MNLPLYMNDAFGFPTALFLGTVIGFGFGFALERAGFGRASVLAAQFYFSDNRVLKVMFSAIVTALLGMVLLSAVGILDMSAVVIPATFLWPQVIGGLLLGIGFIVSGYCPGTSVVATASGKLDGLFTVLGVIAGSLLFGLGFDRMSVLYESGYLGEVRLTDLLGVPQAVLAVGVTLMAVGAFIGVERLEQVVARRNGEPAPESSRRVRTLVFRGFAAAAALGVALLLVPPRPEATTTRTRGTVTVEELASWLIESPTSFFLVDVRDREAWETERIPGAHLLPTEGSAADYFDGFPNTRRLVVYGDAGLQEPPTGSGSFTGDLVVLEGGYAAFKERILNEPVLPEQPTADDLETYRRRSALRAYFTGAELKKPPAVQPRVVKRAAKKKAGGC